MMKFQFNKDLDYQMDAISSIVDIFEGQKLAKSNFTVTNTYNDSIGFIEGTGKSVRVKKQEETEGQFSIGVGNHLILDDEDITKNIRHIQLKNGIKQSLRLKSKRDYNFTVEMETGTGKTYVYLRTIFELHKKYGFSKYVIVVPSIAVKEGVYKSLQITEEHLKGIYQNESYEYFIYDSSKLEQVRNFATSDTIQIMVINIDAFRRSFDDPEKETSANIIHRRNDKLSGMKPIQLIAETNPIVIIDEPQSVDTTKNSKKAIESLNPLCTFRYSATHVEKHHMVYRLDSIDAYEKQLVKQIEVASITAQNSDNEAYLELISVDSKKTPITAKIKIGVQDGTKIKYVPKTVKVSDDLWALSGYRDVYEGYQVKDIYTKEGFESVYFTSKEPIKLGEIKGKGLSDDEVKRAQIRKTIEEHLDKEVVLNKKGIKVLSLFFIDKVANYRDYDDNGNQTPGKYAIWFEEEYKRIRNLPKYNDLLGEVDIDQDAHKAHDGYFSIDNKGRFKDSRTDNSGELKANKDDESTFNKIMRNKESLLSFEEPLRFIFSHSALKEGWDNPNVFQICTLNETNSEIKKRQEIGRGLRLAVNQDGERVHGFDINTLTVMANQSYDEFVSSLQKEIEKEEGIRFGYVEDHYFANIKIGEGENVTNLGEPKSAELWKHLHDMDYVDSKGKVQDKLRTAIKNEDVILPDEFKDVADTIIAKLRKVAGNLNIKDNSKKQKIALNKQVFLSLEFKELWDRIKYKTTYSVEMDEEKLIDECVFEIRDNLHVGKAKLIYAKAKVNIDEGGLTTEEGTGETIIIEDPHYQLPDVITYLQNKTNITRKAIVEILTKSKSLSQFIKNPQTYMDSVAEIIQRKMKYLIIDGIKYRKLGDNEYYTQELFENQELNGYLEKNMMKANLHSNKYPYEHVVYDSDVEETFAKRLEKDTHVKVYAKLPDWFKIDTPLGSYNPDWAVLFDKDGVERVYFVAETKGSTIPEDLRDKERSKIKCGIKHFEAIGTGAKLSVCKEYDDLIDDIYNESKVEYVTDYITHGYAAEE
ncbi:type III restriction enzyme [Fusibacter tunisiensis]|uniref:Type III restriction enzyme n=2 Tax=Fusibacter tunisiensis TaxID=1008308 RepID=A0ABS2MSW4_9FIRM|nr:type III restriction enzyme [Fusibacter tunisiensis]